MTNAERSRHARNWIALIEEAAREYSYAAPHAHSPEQAEAYLRGLIGHVAERDLARAFELRIGVRQADWSESQVQAFADDMTKKPHADPQRPLSRPYAAFDIERSRREVAPPVTEADLRVYVSATVSLLIDKRRARPKAELPLIICGLLSTGDLLTTTTDREDRIAFVHQMAQREPLFGWLVAADMFIHTIDTGAGSASKQDVIGVHFGTREVRGCLTVPYAVKHGRVELEPERLLDLREPEMHATDPYAFIFAPPTKGAPS